MIATNAQCAAFPTHLYMIMVHAIDAEQNNTEEAKVAHFVLFGRHGETIVGKDA